MKSAKMLPLPLSESTRPTPPTISTTHSLTTFLLPLPERPEVLRRYAASFTQKRDIPRDYAACKSQLLPVVRDPAYYGLTYLMFKAKGADISKLNFVTREFAPGLAVGIAHDTPNNIATIGASQLATWQVTPEQAFDQALSNLREKSSEPRFKEL